MKFAALKIGLLFLLSFSFVACEKEEDLQHGDNYIRTGNEYYSLDQALAIYDNTNSKATLFALELSGENDNLARFDDLEIAKTTILPAGTFVFHKPTNSQDYYLNRFHSFYMRYRSNGHVEEVTSSTVGLTGRLRIDKNGDNYLIKGTMTKDGKEWEVSYKGTIEHMEAW